MEVIVQSAEGAVEDPHTILSVRAGASRRQGAVQVRKSLNFPVCIEDARPFKVDLLRQVGVGECRIGAEDGDYSVVMEPPSKKAGGNPMRLRLRVKGNFSLCGTCRQELKSPRLSPRSSPSPPRALQSALGGPGLGEACNEESPECTPEPRKASSSTEEARQYFDNFNVMCVVQALLEALIRDQPTEPFRYISSFMDRLSKQVVNKGVLEEPKDAKQMHEDLPTCDSDARVRQEHPEWWVAAFDMMDFQESGKLDAEPFCAALRSIYPQLSADQARALCSGVAPVASGANLTAFCAAATAVQQGEACAAEVAGLSLEKYCALRFQAARGDVVDIRDKMKGSLVGALEDGTLQNCFAIGPATSSVEKNGEVGPSRFFEDAAQAADDGTNFEELSKVQQHDKAAKAQAERLATESAAKAATERLVAELASAKDQARLGGEAAAKAEAELLAAEIAAKAEAKRLTAEVAAAKAESAEAQAAAKAKAEHLEAAKAQAERLAAEFAAEAETERLSASEQVAAARAELAAANAEVVAAKAEAENLAVAAARAGTAAAKAEAAVHEAQPQPLDPEKKKKKELLAEVRELPIAGVTDPLLLREAALSLFRKARAAGTLEAVLVAVKQEQLKQQSVALESAEAQWLTASAELQNQLDQQSVALESAKAEAKAATDSLAQLQDVQAAKGYVEVAETANTAASASSSSLACISIAGPGQSSTAARQPDASAPPVSPQHLELLLRQEQLLEQRQAYEVRLKQLNNAAKAHVPVAPIATKPACPSFGQKAAARQQPGLIQEDATFQRLREDTLLNASLTSENDRLNDELAWLLARAAQAKLQK